MTKHEFAVTYYQTPQQRASRLPVVMAHFALVARELNFASGVEPEIWDKHMSTVPGANVRSLGWRYLAGG